MEFINSLFSWIIKKRIHQIELFIKFPLEVQNEILLELIQQAKKTEFGRIHNFNYIKNYEQFKQNVPLQDYESLKPLFDRTIKGEQNIFWNTEIKWFAKSSGTVTGKSKFIPVSKASLLNCHYKGGKDLLAIYHHNHSQSKLIKGKTLVVGGSSELNKHQSGSYYGDLSAIIIKNFPIWVEQRRVPKISIALMSDWEKKIDAMVKSTSKENVSNISGVPSWTLVLLQKIISQNNVKDITEIWPNLELFMHGGVNFQPYKNQFEQLIPTKTMNYYENYNASEGFFGLQDQSKVSEMLLMLDYGIFYEFIQPNGNIIQLSEVRLHINYELVITTNAGLWRYKMGDTIQFTSLNPHRIIVTGRVKHFINAFGEELIIENAENAIHHASKKTNAILKEFTVCPSYLKNNQSGKHQWLIEFQQKPADINLFTNYLDEHLKAENSDYEAKRIGNIILTLPEIIVIKKGTFLKWLTINGKLGGQHKIPRLNNNRIFAEEILNLN